MGCNGFLTKEHDILIRESATGKHTGPGEETQRIIDEMRPVLEKVDKRWERAESLSVDPERLIAPDLLGLTDEQLIKIIKDDPDKIIISGGDFIPFFATDFEDSGQELKEHVKKYPQEFPETKVYTPVLPTVENLKRMLKDKNPHSTTGELINFHHYEQENKLIMLIEQQQHTGFTKEIHYDKEGKRNTSKGQK